MNDNFNNRSNENINEESKAKTKNNGKLWKKVTFGSVAGFLFGAGAIFSIDQFKAWEPYRGSSGGTHDSNADGREPISTDDAANVAADDAAAVVNDPSPDIEMPMATVTTYPPAVIYNEAPVAYASDNWTFSEAFDEARRQVGPGGVFSWHGGIYGTYYEHEWERMSDAQQSAFLRSIHPQVGVEQVRADLLDETHPDVMVNINVNHFHGAQATQEEQYEPIFDNDDDVYILGHDYDVLGYGQVQGHDAVSLDIDRDGVADVVLIDADDSGTLSDPDVVVYKDGSTGNIGDLGNGCPCGGGEDDFPANTNHPDTNNDPNNDPNPNPNPEADPGINTDVTPDVIDDGAGYM